MPFSFGIDTLEPAFPTSDAPIPYVSHGLRFDEAAREHVQHTLNAKRVFVIASKSLSTNTSALERLQNALGNYHVGTHVGMTPHTLASEVVQIAQQASALKPDCLITLGAGSMTDASKVIAWMLANDITTTTGLWSMWSGSPDLRTDLFPASIQVIAIPTSLSGGEYTSLAGVTDDVTHEKRLFLPPPHNPSLVILDPELTRTTPDRVWLSTGVRAVDHCIETLCSLRSTADADASAARGLSRLVPALLRCRNTGESENLDAHFECQRGVIDAIGPVNAHVPMGASHAIGHQLGPLGVGHGETSCVMLPAVCHWNARMRANNDRQAKCVEILMAEDSVRRLLQQNKDNQPADLGDNQPPDLGDILDLVIRQLNLPRSLRQVGVGRDRLQELAVNSLKDPWIGTNALPITTKEQVLEILEMVVD